ncbi:MAG: uracil-DNA glycosylase [Frankiales bacterium]|nr:uracil-DNA glycosylase [Frankiales bacterium]
MAERKQGDATPFIPSSGDLRALRKAAAGCRGCDLYEGATQVVFGSGPPSARVVLVGEQPGDQEDRQGEPFVGPAGGLLDKALADAGIDRAQAYVTNAVKHFKFTQSAPGKRRIHAKPEAWEVSACRPWLSAELTLLDPQVVVALGATAAQSLLGSSFRVSKQRGVLLPWPPPTGPFAREADLFEDDSAGRDAFILATLHPSAVLRSDDREAAYAGLVADLAVVAKALG